jgi:hypothetical protein
MPAWLVWIAAVSLVIAIACAIVVALDIALGRRQKMWIMDVVWPVTMLWSGPLGLWAYVRWGRAGAPRPPFPVQVAKATTHCGAGCTLGDLVAENVALLVPVALFGHHLFGTWIYDYVAAFGLGIVFQYFTIKPMKQLSRGEGVVAAVKADSLSLSAWQLGMYGGIAIAVFAVFRHPIPKSDPVFWFVMQLAMWLGFATSYPVNWWLVRSGRKEAM